MTTIDNFTHEKDLKALTDAVLDLSLPKVRWTHRAHLATAYELLHRHSVTTVSRILPDIIRRYNEATDTPNTDHDGYHHTITLFYIRAIDKFISELTTDTPYLVGFDALINGPHGGTDYPLKFYSRVRLLSVDARRQWLTPDRADL